MSKILKLDLEFDKEIDFETASDNCKNQGFIDVYFSENGTLVFGSEDLCFGNCYSYSQTNILTFAMSKTSMAFDFCYTEDNHVVRSKTELNGEVTSESGEKLGVEKENDDMFEVIWNQLSEILGKSYWTIGLNEKAYRFVIKNSVNSPAGNVGIKNEEKLPREFDEFDFLSPFHKDKLKNRSKDELIELFNQMVKHAQQNSINFFMNPGYYRDSSVFMVNMMLLQDVIYKHDDDLLELLNSKIPLKAFGAIGKADEQHVDKRIYFRMLQLIKAMEPIQQNQINKQTKEYTKWWEFWK